MSTSTFIEQLYTNFLGRASDPAGKEFWVQQIDSGLQSAAEVSLNFIDSSEFSGVVSPVARLYYAALNRIPDAGGLDFWIEAFRNGSSIEEISNSFVESSEFQAKYGNALDNAAFLDLLYQNVFSRDADTGGKAFWLDAMANGGFTRADVLLSFANSEEHINDKGDDIKIIVQYHGITGNSPTQSDIDAAIANGNPESVIASLYASADYSGETVPGLSGSDAGDATEGGTSDTTTGGTTTSTPTSGGGTDGVADTITISTATVLNRVVDFDISGAATEDIIDVTTPVISIDINATPIGATDIELDGVTAAINYTVASGILTFSNLSAPVNPVEVDIQRIITILEGLVTNVAVGVLIDMDNDGTNDATLLFSEHDGGSEAILLIGTVADSLTTSGSVAGGLHII